MQYEQEEQVVLVPEAWVLGYREAAGAGKSRWTCLSASLSAGGGGGVWWSGWSNSKVDFCSTRIFGGHLIKRKPTVGDETRQFAQLGASFKSRCQ